MSRYSSESDGSSSKRKKKSSRRSSSRSASPKRKICKKSLKKYKNKTRSPSRERSRTSNDSSSRRKKYSRSPSSRRSRRRRSRSVSKDRRHKKSKKRDYRRRSSSRSSLSSSSSSSSSSVRKNRRGTSRIEDDGEDLLKKLNAAAIEAMARNKSTSINDPSFMIEMQMKRADIIKDINASGFTSETFTSGSKANEDLLVKASCSDPPPQIQAASAKPQSKGKETPHSVLHPNFLLENKEDKLNRWVRKLFLIRQRALNGDWGL